MVLDQERNTGKSKGKLQFFQKNVITDDGQEKNKQWEKAAEHKIKNEKNRADRTICKIACDRADNNN